MVIVMNDARDTVEFVASVRMNLAVQNMLAAARFSRRVAELEKIHGSEEFGAFWDEILHNSIASIMCCTSSLEAYANELFFDRGTIFKKIFYSIARQSLGDLWTEEHSRKIRVRFAAQRQTKHRQEFNLISRC